MRIDPDALRDALEIAALDTLRGDPPGPLLASRVQRAVGDVLRRFGLTVGPPRGAIVRVSGGGTRVEVLLPAEGPRAQRVVLDLGPC